MYESPQGRVKCHGHPKKHVRKVPWTSNKFLCKKHYVKAGYRWKTNFTRRNVNGAKSTLKL